MTSVAEFVDRFRSDRARYERLAPFVQDRIAAVLKRARVPAEHSFRVKDLSSYAKKLHKREIQDDTIRDAGDKAGVRAVVRFPDQLSVAKRAICAELPDVRCDDKSEALDPDEFTYVGIHWDVALPRSNWDGSEEFAGMSCEVQLQTQAQRLWSDLSHDVVYKSPTGERPPRDIERRNNRLMALCEIIDSEFQSLRQSVMSDERVGNGQILTALDAQYYRFLSEPYDHELSLLILSALGELIADPVEYGERLAAFVDANEAKLQELFAAFAPRRERSALMFQPEALLVFEQLEVDPFRLEAAWAKAMARADLAELAIAWGKPF